MKPRIAVAGFHTECSTWSPVLIQADDFRQLRGADLLAHPEFVVLNRFDADWHAILHARSVPGGPVARPAYDGFKSEILAGLRAALPLDGIYLAMHGGAFVDGMTDCEGDLLSAVREVAGSDCVIAASYDLHGNVSQAVVDALDIFAAFRTAPHVDIDETKHRACKMLFDAIQGGPRPFVGWARIPVLLQGERTSTTVEPAASLYAALPVFDMRPGVTDANLMVGFAWADDPRSTACAVVTGTDRAAIAATGREIALSYWNARRDFRFGAHVHSLAECLAIAEAATTRPIVLADAGDNPTAGGVADRAEILAECLRRGYKETLVAGIADRPAVDACYAAGVGATIELSIGATLNPAGSTPVRATATVLNLSDDAGPDRQAVIEIAGITVILAARRRPYYDTSAYEALGVDWPCFRLLVVKLGYLQPDLAALANPPLMALTNGVVDPNIESLPIRHIPRPTYPWDDNFAYAPDFRFSRRAP